MLTKEKVKNSFTDVLVTFLWLFWVPTCLYFDKRCMFCAHFGALKVPKAPFGAQRAKSGSTAKELSSKSFLYKLSWKLSDGKFDNFENFGTLRSQFGSFGSFGSFGASKAPKAPNWIWKRQSRSESAIWRSKRQKWEHCRKYFKQGSSASHISSYCIIMVKNLQKKDWQKMVLLWNRYKEFIVIYLYTIEKITWKYFCKK